MTYQYEVGDIVKLKKQHPCGRLPSEMHRVRSSNHDCTETGGKKHKKFTEKE